MATFTGNTIEAASGSGGPSFIFDQIGTDYLSATKIVFGADGAISAAWSFNTGALDDGTPRMTLATDDPAVVALEAIESYLDTEVAAQVTALEIIDDLAAQSADYDTGAGTATTVMLGIALPASGGPVAGGTSSNPFRTDPTGTTAQPASQSGTWNITDVSGTISLPTGAATAAKQDTIIGHLDGVEALLTTIDTDTGNIATALQLLDNAVVDHGAAAVAGVRPIGLEGRSTAPTAVDDGDAVRALATLLGKQVIYPYALPANTWQYASVSGGVTDTADDAAKAAAGSGSRNYVTHASVVNAHGSTSTEVVIKSGSTIIWRGWAQAAGGGVAERFDPPLRGGDNEAINVTNITTGAQTYFNLQGFVAAE